MEDEIFKGQQSLREKTTLLFTFAFEKLVSGMFKGTSGLLKVDVAFTNRNAVMIYSYNNGNEVNFYDINPETLNREFAYMPGSEKPEETVSSRKLDFSIDEAFDIVSRAFDNWALKTNPDSEYPRDLLGPLRLIGRFDDDTTFFAVPIGFRFHWHGLDVISRLFDEFILSVQRIWTIIKDELLNGKSYEEVIGLFDFLRIISRASNSLIDYNLGITPSTGNEITNSSFDILCNIASLPYERRINYGQFGLLDMFNSDEAGCIFLQQPLQISMSNTRELRKLLEMAHSGIDLLVYQGKVIGIGSSSLCKRKIVFKGYGKWRLVFNDITILYTEANRCYTTCTLEGVDFRKIFTRVFGCECNSEHISDRMQAAIMSIKHGTGIIISHYAKDEAARLCKLHRGIPVETFSMIESNALLRGITSIDGALMIDENGICYAIGVILDGTAVIPGDTARGARYNSLTNYVACEKANDHPACMAVIISEDGGIDIYPNVGAHMPTTSH